MTDAGLMTTAEVAKKLHVSKSTVLRYVHEGHLPGTIKLPSGYLRIPAASVEALMQKGREDVDLDRP